MIHQVRVIFGDTDQMGVVYYANYLRYFEAARAALLRACGLSGRDLAALAVGFPVTESYCKYRRPARYEDLLDVDIQVAHLGGAMVRFVYQVRREAWSWPTGTRSTPAPAIRADRCESPPGCARHSRLVLKGRIGWTRLPENPRR